MSVVDRIAVGATALVALSLTACTDTAPRAADVPEQSTDSSQTPTQTTSPPRDAPKPERSRDDERAEGTPVEVPRRHSLQAVMARHYTSGPVQEVREVADYGAYTRSEVRYRSDGLWVTGILNVPRGEGPFPALVLNHGYIEPSIYVTGQGLAREQDYLARAGYVVLHTDYRGHAGSDPVTLLDRETRIGYTEDVITAVLALKKLRYVDPDRVGLFGRSMGGGVTYNALVAKPGLVDGAVVYAPVSSRFLDNVSRWTIPERPDIAATLFDRLGPPRPDSPVYRDLSARTFFDRVTEPVLIHHGTLDESCPLRWSRSTLRALDRSQESARLVVYAGEPHAFLAAWERSIRISVRFLDRNL